ncbi:unnamed protein product [Diatraea saccharalis]|uniref:Uncharacterized protein n=1 Tax=Diatraea saccharalis TaxID=40085 RepID=A0A9N9WG01_9NEOP|nr:unnamed protein product [Diatraea saccharalis]
MGVLRWPKKAIVNKLIKDENSRPGADWTSMSCTLKRNDLRSYKEADDELSNMERNTDTEVEEAGGDVNMGLTRQLINFDELAENLRSLYSIPHNSTSVVIVTLRYCQQPQTSKSRLNLGQGLSAQF